MRVLVCGSRNCTGTAFVYRELDALHRRLMISTVIEGDQRGVDRMAGFWARRNKIDNLKFPADWVKFGKAAGPIRNQRMLDEGRPDLVIAFPGGIGTAGMVRLAEAADVRVILVNAP